MASGCAADNIGNRMWLALHVGREPREACRAGSRSWAGRWPAWGSDWRRLRDCFARRREQRQRPTGDGVLSNNAKTTADVRGASRASARGASWRRPPGVLDGGRMSRAHIDNVQTCVNASCARASSGVFARTEQHVGQLFDGTPSPGHRGSTVTLCEPPRPGDRAVFRERGAGPATAYQAVRQSPAAVPQPPLLARRRWADGGFAGVVPDEHDMSRTLPRRGGGRRGGGSG